VKDESLLPPILRDRAPAGRWPLELRLQLAEALASGLPRGETLTAIAAKHGVSQGALSKAGPSTAPTPSLKPFAFKIS